ncbi:MAG: YoaH family protein [Haemophilus paraphrohaemolyticus]|uniref:YoaH family protein n=1 Tax=Haemophilus paraphrohaemolyticus TaxID=736 RepID=UPI001ECA8685|nr:YoaH family protein [Haemophilus paraphrohaemolyticus]MBS6674061.1 YoaH family protein [Haemophilus paraphrohaemolyticus]
MDNALLSLTHEQQQEAVEEIQKIAKQGISMGQAIQIVANQLREKYQQNQLDQTEKTK